MSSLSAFGWLQSSLGIDITGEWQGIVNLNVGGVAFTCQRRTFQSGAEDSVLCKMALTTDRQKVPRSEDGSVILDRDPETFRHILNFLRSNQEKLCLPDDFSEWDLLLDDARVYQLGKLRDAILAHPRYQQRCFFDSLPHGVMIRWVENGNDVDVDEITKNEEKETDETQKKSRDRIDVYPPLQLFGVNATSGFLVYQSRIVRSIDEAVMILLSTYQMKVDVWHRDVVEGNLNHTVFLTKKK